MLTNLGGEPLDWSAQLANAPDWVSLSITGGTLQPGGTVNVVVGLTSAANLLGAGAHTTTLNFSDLTASVGTDRAVQLQIDVPAYGFLAVMSGGWLCRRRPGGRSLQPDQPHLHADQHRRHDYRVERRLR